MTDTVTRWDFASRTVTTRLTPDENRMMTQWRLDRLKPEERWPRSLKRLEEFYNDHERMARIHVVGREPRWEMEWDYKDHIEYRGGSSAFKAWLLRLDRVVRDREKLEP